MGDIRGYIDRSLDSAGFTLIEMSLVLVIIGLIIGGILVGTDLISAAAVRAQIAQIEKYSSAVNTFTNKYGGLPGDLNATLATQFGFIARGTWIGEGDGDGILNGNCGGAGAYGSYCQKTGETTVFWVDLSTANLIDGGFSTAVSNNGWGQITPISGIANYFPKSKINDAVYVYVLSYKGRNYFVSSAVTQIDNSGLVTSSPGISVQQAYNIDKKADDGLPQSGSISAQYLDTVINTYSLIWAAGGGVVGVAPGTAQAQTSSTCYDNGGNANATMQYSMGQSANSGTGLNCALTFKFE